MNKVLASLLVTAAMLVSTGSAQARELGDLLGVSAPPPKASIVVMNPSVRQQLASSSDSGSTLPSTISGRVLGTPRFPIIRGLVKLAIIIAIVDNF